MNDGRCVIYKKEMAKIIKIAVKGMENPFSPCKEWKENVKYLLKYAKDNGISLLEPKPKPRISLKASRPSYTSSASDDGTSFGGYYKVRWD